MVKQLQKIGTLCLLLMLAIVSKAESVKATWDFTNADVVAAVTALSGSTEAGTIKAVEDNGILLTVEANGQTIRNNGNSIQTGNPVVFKVPVKSAKDVVTVVGYPGYFAYSIAGTDATEATTAYTATAADVNQGYVEIVSKGQYIISISATLADDGSQPAADVTAQWNWKQGIPASIANVHVEGKTGSVASDVDGIELYVDATHGKLKTNGDNVQFNAGTILRVPVKSAGDEVTVEAHSYNFSNIKIGGTVYDTRVTEYKAKATDATNGYVEIESTESPYLVAITVVQKAAKQAVTLTDEPSTATFAFNEGTEGQTAVFSNADYFLTSKVTYGSNLTLKDKSTLTDAETQASVVQTRFEPATKLNTPDEASAVRFLITPKPGLKFTPTKVSLNVTRYGTDNGLVDVNWENADGTTAIATEVKPERNNKTPNISKLSYDVTGATAAEGTQALLLYLYSLQDAKQFGLDDIIIEGTLNGTEQEAPVLATLTINGKEYTAEAIFDTAYDAEMELSKKEKMIGESNPITATASTGEIGTITYEGDDTKCVVTIPMTKGSTNMNYVLTIVQKPDFTLTYIDTDKKTVLATAIREKDETIGQFDLDFAQATAEEGMKVRGWYFKTAGGEKYTADYVVKGDINLYAVATEIETVSTHKKYIFDLTDKLFDAADHEAFNPSGDGFYYHDNQHGWAFKNGNKVDLLVGPKATVSVTLCRYGNADDIIITDAQGTQIGTLPGMNKENTDGEIVAFNYEGAGGTITLNMNTSGEMYIHGVKIVNTAETNYESKGNWYFVKAGDASSLIDVLDVVNGVNAAKDAPRSFIYLPNGIYDLNETVKTAISGHNISIIGESMDKTIIVTAPDKSIEGLGKADMFQNSGSNLYLQDLTLMNALDYYNAGSAGRAAVIQDSGNRTIGKRVRMLSYQDTYYSSNASQQAYWEDCDIHGTVDFICGGGDIRFQNTTISLEPRQASGKGGRTVTAPTTNTQFGYVFDNCNVVDLAEGKGDWNFGRTWQNTPICVWLNTTLDDNAASTLIASRWTQQGMNNKDPKVFGEYNTKNAAGVNITPASNTINSYGGAFETILTAEQAGGYSYDAMFKNNAEKPWDPAALAAQADAPKDLKLNGNQLTWTAGNAKTWVVLKDGEIVAIITTPSYTVDDATAEYEVRAANEMGGLSEGALLPTSAIVKTSTAGYATFYDSKHSYEIPLNLKAYVVEYASADQLSYKEIQDIIPAGTAVMLESNYKTDVIFTLTSTKAGDAYLGANWLRGSDEATTTFADNDSYKFYKLTFGHSGTEAAKTFGWFWGARNGAAFQIEAHRAWLVVPEILAASRGYSIDGNGITGISSTIVDSNEADVYYNMQGQRIAAPSKGMYIHNNKKVIIK